MFDVQRGDVPSYQHALLPRAPLSAEQRLAFVAHVLLWLRTNNVRFAAADLALAIELVRVHGETIGLGEAFAREHFPAAGSR